MGTRTIDKVKELFGMDYTGPMPDKYGSSMSDSDKADLEEKARKRKEEYANMAAGLSPSGKKIKEDKDDWPDFQNQDL